MKKYNITVNGNTYEVEVEEVERGNNINAGSNLVGQPTPPTPKPVPEVKRKEKIKNEMQQEAQTPPVEVETISAPMPGSIFEVKVSVGDTVAEGDTLLILEAMKMENEIMAPRDGRIAEVNTSKGQTVDTGDPLISLE